MRLILLTIVFAALLLPSVDARPAAPRELEPVRGAVPVHGSVVFTDGTPQRNVKGRCVTLEKYEAYFGPKSPKPDGTMKYFGSEWCSGRDGTFELSLAPGGYMLWAHGAKHKATKLTVRKGAREAAVTVIGRAENVVAPMRFLSPDGLPLRNISTSGGLHTNADGIHTRRFENSDWSLPAQLFFWIKGVGYAAVTVHEEDLLRTDSLPVQFKKGTYVSGAAVSEHGRPLGGVVIFPLRVEKKGVSDEFKGWNGLFTTEPCSMLWSNAEAATTTRDGDGSFTVGPLPPGDYSFCFAFPRAQEESFRFKLEQPLQVTEGEPAGPMKTTVPVGEVNCELRGRLIDGRSSKPISNASVSINIQSSGPPIDDSWVEHWYIWEPIVHRVKTGKNGEFTLYPLDAGVLWFDISWNRICVWNRRVILPCPGKTVDFVLQPPVPEPKSASPPAKRKKQ